MNYKTLSLTIVIALVGTSCTFAQPEPVAPNPPAAPMPPSEGGGGGGGAGGKESARAARSAADAQRHMAEAAINSAKAQVHASALQGGFGWADGSRERSSLFIGVSNPDKAGIAETEEDMAVMARILDRAASGHDGQAERAMGIFIKVGGMGSQKNLYIDGYGAIFFLDVNYPLTPPSVKKDSEAAHEDERSEWDETKRELEHPADSSAAFDWDFAGASGPGEEYQRDKVEALKQRILTAMQNAAHLRHLGRDEFVTVVITGANSKRTIRSASANNSRPRQNGGDGARANHLVFRAKKSDIDAVGKKTMTEAAFVGRVNVALY